MADVLKSAVVASQWWTKKICDTANLENFTVGDRNESNSLLTLIATLNATSHTPTPEAAETFGIVLQSIIMRELENNPEHQVLLRCLSTPDELLCEAAERAGIDTSVFPVQRTMRVTADCVLVSDGSKRPFKNLMVA